MVIKSYHIILAVKILGWFLLKWAGFGELLGWKSSTRSGNTVPVSSFILSERCTEKPVSSMAESGTIADIQVSVRQITQQSLVSRWYEMRARSSQSPGTER